MPIGFLLSQLSRDRIDLKRDAVAFEAVIERLRIHLDQERLLTEAASVHMTSLENTARRILRIHFERDATAEEMEELHAAVTELRQSLLRRG